MALDIAIEWGSSTTEGLCREPVHKERDTHSRRNMVCYRLDSSRSKYAGATHRCLGGNAGGACMS